MPLQKLKDDHEKLERLLEIRGNKEISCKPKAVRDIDPSYTIVFIEDGSELDNCKSFMYNIKETIMLYGNENLSLTV